jgi:hypothetical protein
MSTYDDVDLLYDDYVTLYDAGSTYAEVIKGSAVVAIRMSVLDDNLEQTGISAPVATGGEVVVDGSTLIRRTFSLPLAAIYVPDVDGSVWWGSPIQIEYGVWVDGIPEWVPIFTGYADDAEGSVTHDGEIGMLTGRDRFKLLDRPLTEPLVIPAGTRVNDGIRLMCEAVGLGTDDALYDLDDDGKTFVADATYEAGVNRLDVMAAWSDDYALAIYAAPDGRTTCRPFVDPSTSTPVASYQRGAEMRLLGFSKRWRDRIRNRAVVIGVGDSGPIRAELRDLNPASPTYNPTDGTGPLGDRPDFYRSDGITTQEQADAVAAARLPILTAMDEEIEGESVVNPALEYHDVIEVIEESTDTSGNYLLGRFNIPLVVNGTQSFRTGLVRSLDA